MLLSIMINSETPNRGITCRLSLDEATILPQMQYVNEHWPLVSTGELNQNLTDKIQLATSNIEQSFDTLPHTRNKASASSVHTFQVWKGNYGIRTDTPYGFSIFSCIEQILLLISSQSWNF